MKKTIVECYASVHPSRIIYTTLLTVEDTRTNELLIVGDESHTILDQTMKSDHENTPDMCVTQVGVVDRNRCYEALFGSHPGTFLIFDVGVVTIYFSAIAQAIPQPDKERHPSQHVLCACETEEWNYYFMNNNHRASFSSTKDRLDFHLSASDHPSLA